jgi:hypothetical protein
MRVFTPVLIFVASFILMLESAIAGQVKPRPVSCYLFQGEKLVIRNICTFESTSWAGGGGSILTWKDGIKTRHAWGLQGRGERVCPEGEESIDQVCGKSYERNSKTLKSLSINAHTQSTQNNLHCVQLKQKSVCWLF